MASLADHTRLINDVLLLLGKEARDMGAFFRMETGMALNPRTEQPFMYGIKSGPDIMGITIYGYVGFEIKTGNATQTADQKNFEKMVLKFNQNYWVVREANQALEFLRGLKKCST